MDRLDLIEAMRRAAVEVASQPTTQETLQAIVDVACTTLPEIDHAGVTILQRGRPPETAAATDEFVRVLDRLQYDVGQGPCLSALDPDEPDVVVVEHARHDTRWHQFIPAAVAHGLRSQLGVRLFARDTTIGMLNLYSTSDDVISEDTRHLAQLFATHAALAYGQVRKLDNLQTALASRESIGRAVGIVMERYQLSPERAFDYLVRVSATSEVKLRDLADELVKTTRDQHDAGPGIRD